MSLLNLRPLFRKYAMCERVPTYLCLLLVSFINVQVVGFIEKEGFIILLLICMEKNTFFQRSTIPGYVFNLVHTETIFGIYLCLNWCISGWSHENKRGKVSGSFVHKGHASDSIRPHFLLMDIVFRKLCNVFL